MSKKLPVIVHPEINEEALRSEKGVSLVAFLDTVRKRKDGTSSVKLKIIHQRYPAYFSTKISLTEKDYLKLFERRINSDLKEKKVIIHTYLMRAYSIINMMDEFSFSEFKEHFKKKRIDAKSVYTYYERYIAQLKSEDRLGTAQNYEYSMKKLKEFHGKKSIAFETITPTFLRQFENWMIANGHSRTTVGIYCRPLKKIINDAIEDGILDSKKSPFGDVKRGRYKSPEPENPKKALTLEEIGKIINYSPEPGSPEHYYRDMWVFSYLGNGINMKDVCLLKYKDIYCDTIVYAREKVKYTNRSAKTISIALIDKNKEIIERWGNQSGRKDGFIFPVLEGNPNEEEIKKKVQQFVKQVNKYMKRISEKLDLNVSVTTYYARHSFVTVLVRSGVDIHTIAESVGHSSMKVIDKYIASISNEEKVKNVNKLLKFE
ncbi:tyrosine-type recombinase/integrase [Marinifilum sp. D737]|uniref:tyrosine-type recombinase/integrase n=1 Tax=Marinifilum sp. D737 TaxID=2969628 RepID=UPI0022752FFF|nr:site-specific integrase [Marinifilum sp. D737]MCY1636401.1 site-specific integrase [Marinifilum sp. D737]